MVGAARLRFRYAQATPGTLRPSGSEWLRHAKPEGRRVVGPPGFEPGTSRLKVACSTNGATAPHQCRSPMERGGGGQPMGGLAYRAARDWIAPVGGDFGQRSQDEAAAGKSRCGM